MRGRMNRTRSLGKVFMVVLGICVMGGAAWADMVEITISDAMGSDSTWGDYSNVNNSVNENDEVENNCVTGEQWDLEAMFIRDGQLTISGGWNFRIGEAHNDSGWLGTPVYEDGRFTSGDIFIAVGEAPLYGNPPAVTLPGFADTYKYDFIIDIDWTSANLDYDVYRVTPTIVEDPPGEPVIPIAGTEVVYYNQNDGANPWLYLGGGFNLGFGGQAGYATGVTGIYGDTVNEVSFDLSWLHDTTVNVGDEDDVYFHFTQECGNDSIMGQTTGLITRQELVPEPASIGLLGMGIVGMVFTRGRKKKL